MRDEEDGIFKEFCELVKMYMWQTRDKKSPQLLKYKAQF